MSESSVVVSSVPNEILFEEPYKRLLPEFEALKVDELVAVNLDIPVAVTTVLGTGPEIAVLAERIAKLPELALEHIKKLDEYAMALSHAHALFLMASQPPDSLLPLVDEGATLRETLFMDASALVRRGHLDGNRLKDLKGPKGYRNLAVDLQILANLFKESFAKIETKSDVKQAEILRAEQLAAGILRGVGLREQGTALIASTADIRVRAFTLLTHWYDQARRAVSYLRWDEDDVETIAPSLYTGRGGRKRSGTDVPSPVVAPGATPPGTGSSVPGAATPQPSPGGTSASAATGTPGAHPFLT